MEAIAVHTRFLVNGLRIVKIYFRIRNNLDGRKVAEESHSGIEENCTVFIYCSHNSGNDPHLPENPVITGAIDQRRPPRLILRDLPRGPQSFNPLAPAAAEPF